MSSKKRAQRSESEDESDASDTRVASAKKAKTSKAAASEALPGGGQRDDNGDVFWELTDTRRLTVSEFKGKTMISVREYYEKDGKSLPGKKGITLPMTQFAALVRALPALDLVLKEKGQQLPRPDYKNISTSDIPPDSDDEAASKKEKKRAKKEKKKRKEKKRNFEETSEED